MQRIRIRTILMVPALAVGLAAACGDDESGLDCPVCDDGIACTADRCIESLGECEYRPHDSRCAAGEVCDRELGCVPAAACGSDADCDDGDPCTDDRCQQGACSHQFSCACQSDADCDDGDPCTDDRCQQGDCRYDDNAAACDDGDACTRDDTCAAGRCQGVAIDCDDGNPCTDDSCDAQLGCQHDDNAAACDDGDACTRDDACLAGRCVGAEDCCSGGLDDDGDGATDCADADCAGAVECGGCQPVAEPEPVSMAPLPGEAAPGRAESVSAGGFDDDYIYDSSDEIKIGTRRQWGGTIVFFGMSDGTPGMNTSNTIDANDTGREVQVAFYDPDRRMQNCAWNASCVDTPSECPESITYLGWNPVQGGNRCNRGSGVESVVADSGVQTVTTVPLFWNPNWDRQDCSDAACDDPDMRDRRSDVRVVQRLRFVRKHVVELEYTVINLGDLDHRSSGQEMPTVYTANGNGGTADLWRLFDSQGNQISIDQPGNDGFFYKHFSSPGGWACMQNDALSYGVGLYSENRLTEMTGWQNRDLPFNNFRPTFMFGIPPHGTVRARAYLLLGSRDTIAAEAAWLDANLPPFGWLDAPAADEAVSGEVTVRGWVLDNKAVSNVEVLVDGGQPTALSVGTARPDVCLVWPAYPECPDVGYSGTLDTSGLSACDHLLEIRATDSDGNQRIIARRRIRVAAR